MRKYHIMFSSIHRLFGFPKWESLPFSSLIPTVESKKSAPPESKPVTTSAPTREVLINASPLYGTKTKQKGAENTCLYHAYNYIRTRYKQSEDKYPAERRIEKIFSSGRRQLGEILSFYFITESVLIRYQETIKNTVKCDFNKFIKFLNSVSIRHRGFSKKANKNLPKLVARHSKKWVHHLKKEFDLDEDDFAEMTFAAIKKYLLDYFHYQYEHVCLKVLNKELHLNFEDLLFEFLQERTDYIKREDVPSMIRVLDKQSLHFFVNAIYNAQEAKLKDLIFLEKENITKNIDSCLDAIEKYGPLCCNFPAKIAQRLDESFVKNANFGFKIYDVKCDESDINFSHAVVIVGGEVNKLSGDYIYYIDPNNKYTFQDKTPIYRMSFEDFKNNLQSCDGGITLTIDGRKNSKELKLAKNYFLFGKNGLNKTRDPVPEDKDMECEPSVPRRKLSSLMSTDSD